MTNRSHKRRRSDCETDSDWDSDMSTETCTSTSNQAAAQFPSLRPDPRTKCYSHDPMCVWPRYTLLACGSNIYGQLSAHSDRAIAIPASSTRTREHPEAVFKTVEVPSCVADGESLRILYAGFNSICFECDGEIVLSGLLPTRVSPAINRTRKRRLTIPLPPPAKASDVVKGFGTQCAFMGLILRDGKILNFTLKTCTLTWADLPILTSDIQINQLGQLAMLYSFSRRSDTDRKLTPTSLTIYPPLPSIVGNVFESTLDIDALESMTAPETSSFSIGQIYQGVDAEAQGSEAERQEDYFTSIAATATGFVALTARGQVYTYGDGRYNSLGRPADAILDLEDTDVGKPNIIGWGLVGALDGINITQIAAHPNGHVQLALCASGAAYIWGGDGTENISGTKMNTRSNDTKAPKETSDMDDNANSVSSDSSEDFDDDVTMIEIEGHGEQDFTTGAVGINHIILASTQPSSSSSTHTTQEPSIWATGSADMAQTGFGTPYRCQPLSLSADEDLKRANGRWRQWKDVDLGVGVRQVVCGFGYTLVVVDSGRRWGRMCDGCKSAREKDALS
ncbi:hypothetical protein TWF696_000501 [Orbilia brochopaga]|uniref:Uncharacterized protein n=1 Tax=Orbilia brochopaga TaxID=3140254 RepID=A0AAV9VBH8_9PEZI